MLVTAAVAALVCVAASGADATHEGEFLSTRPDHMTTLWVIEGAQEALVAYSGSYGPGCASENGWCRSCAMPPRTGAREAAESYLFADEFGKIRLHLVKGAWRLELVEGTMGVLKRADLSCKTVSAPE